MLELHPESETGLTEGALRMLKASSFAADATLDGMIFASRTMASSVVATRGLWLRAWQADMHSKQLVTAYPYRGGKLFGPSLEKILIKTKDKKRPCLGTFTSLTRGPNSFGPSPFVLIVSRAGINRGTGGHPGRPENQIPSSVPRNQDEPFSLPKGGMTG